MITINLPDITPISINDAYTPLGRRLVKTTACRKYENALRLVIAQQVQGTWSINQDKAHRLSFLLFMPDLYTKGWPKNAKHRFTRRDVSNTIKITEDIIADIFGIDDCCFLEIRLVKKLGPLGTVITIEELPDDEE